MREVKIDTEYIKLDQLLKYSGFAQTGGHSKMLIQEGVVLVNDNVVTERGKKIRSGDIVKIEDVGEFVVV
ncbi:RNA-binding S4 domain-containing protein [Anaerosalibacter sp. Marseille-P3206]|uniref:RNA-binding S4 domain-containing protein n=1 Tax=Anaerosalibacter sp. Marseille-P3206 TaxID=1871005 RepID=UPI0009859A57|nr:RNA-binding S4 domain-containing protein [Anaerosalibacter sp. Marseille-P3206]